MPQPVTGIRGGSTACESARQGGEDCGTSTKGSALSFCRCYAAVQWPPCQPLPAVFTYGPLTRLRGAASGPIPADRQCQSGEIVRRQVFGRSQRRHGRP